MLPECIAEDDLLDLARGGKPLGDTPAIEAHLADCPACSGLLAALLATPRDGAERRDLAGRTLGPYRLDTVLGAGAMGEVYRGRDLRLHRHVAVKVLSARFAESPDCVRRLEAEGRAAAAISHPNVVTIYDAGSDDGVPYIVSELIDGESLRSVIDRGPVPRRTALALGLQLARGLAAAHAQGVVHRDLKPGNLIVTDDGTLKILDFGLAKLVGDRDLEATEPGTLLGTSGYLSPEQARGEPADARSDLFAVGAILYELFSGRRAFGGATFAERLSAVLRDTPEPIADAAGPAILRCLEKDPKKRFQSANDLAWVLERLQAPAAPATAPRPPRAVVTRRGFVAGVAAATGAAGLVAGRWLWPEGASFAPEVVQHTWRHGRVASARFTRDGGSLLHSGAWEGEPLATYTARLGGGGTRPLDLPPGMLLAVSSRGEIALSLDSQFVDGFAQRGQLALAPIEGGEPRRLDIAVQHADFTPDGAELAIVRAGDERYTLELPPGKVLFESGWLASPRVSPDGSQVAVLAYDVPTDDRGDVVLVPRGGGKPRVVARNFNTIDSLAWTPDGRRLWISASRAGGNSAVSCIDLDGETRARVPTVGRLRIHDVAPDGRLAVTHSSGRLRTMARAPGAGPGEEQDVGLSDVSLVSGISADGASIVLAEFGDVDTARGAFVRATRGGPALRLGAALPLDFAEDAHAVLAMSPDDGKPILYPVSAGQPRTLPAVKLRLRWVRSVPGDRVLAGGQQRGRPPRLWLADGDTLTPVTDEGVIAPAEVSPDGSRAALVHRGALLLVPLDGRSPPVAVPGRYPEERVCGFAAGGTEVLLRTAAPPVRVRRIAVATGTGAPALEIDPPRVGRRGIFAVVVSDDGAAYAYSYSQELSRLYTIDLSTSSTT